MAKNGQKFGLHSIWMVPLSKPIEVALAIKAVEGIWSVDPLVFCPPDLPPPIPVDPEGDGVVDEDEAPLEDEAMFLEAVAVKVIYFWET